MFRRCGSTHCFFYLEVGRVTKTGAGEIWMETGDPVIAENMNTVILGLVFSLKYSNSRKIDFNGTNSWIQNCCRKETGQRRQPNAANDANKVSICKRILQAHYDDTQTAHAYRRHRQTHQLFANWWVLTLICYVTDNILIRETFSELNLICRKMCFVQKWEENFFQQFFFEQKITFHK